MDDTGDFTFCQVGLQHNAVHQESPKTILNINKITLDDNPEDGVSIHNSSSIQDHNSCKKETADSLEFGESPSNRSCDAVPPKLKTNEQLTPKVVGESGDPLNGSQEQKPIIKKPKVRAKVPFEKGYSQMDWLKLTRTHPDLAGLKGQSNRRLISIDEVRQHKAEDSVWTVLKGRVYNISPYMKFHPGGVDMLMKAAGRDCTSLFNKYHAWVNAEFLMERCLVGVLDDGL